MRDRLLIKKIEISNCGGFAGEPHIIELSSDSKKNFTIIIASNCPKCAISLKLTRVILLS